MQRPVSPKISVQEHSIEVQWDEPEGLFDGFELNCMGHDIDALNQSEIIPHDESSSKYTATCDGLTAGVLYTLSLKTALNEPEREAEHTELAVTGKWHYTECTLRYQATASLNDIRCKSLAFFHTSAQGSQYHKH